MARKTHWKALTRSQKKRRRYNRRNGLLLQIFGWKKGEPRCCTAENPCNPQRDDDWIRDYREYPYLKNRPRENKS